MAGLFRKRKFKPWLLNSIISNNRHLKSKVVKVLCKRSKSLNGAQVMLVADGELSITAVFSDEAVENALSDPGMGSSNWSTALVILHDFTLELNAVNGPDIGEYVLYVNKFNIWDLQPGYYAKYDYIYCMQNEDVIAKMKEELRERKERAACQTDSSMTGSVPLSQLLDEMAKPSSSLSVSGVSDEDKESTTDLSESLQQRLMQPFSVEEFLIPEPEASSLRNIGEWQPDYQPSPSEEPGSSVSDQQFNMCVASTLTEDQPVKNVTSNLGRSDPQQQQGKDNDESISAGRPGDNEKNSKGISEPSNSQKLQEDIETGRSKENRERSSERLEDSNRGCSSKVGEVRSCQDPKEGRCNQEAKQDKTNKEVEYLGISFVSSPEELENQRVRDGKRTKAPACLLFKTEIDSQSQEASSHWQDELDSVRFSFEEESSACGSHKRLQEQDSHKPLDKECITREITTEKPGFMGVRSDKTEIANSNYQNQTQVTSGREDVHSTGINSVEKSETEKENLHGFDKSQGNKNVSEVNSSDKSGKSLFSKSFSQENNTLDMDCFTIGSPTAHSTQIGTAGCHSQTAVNGVGLKDQTEKHSENGIFLATPSCTNVVECQSSSHNLETNECKEFDASIQSEVLSMGDKDSQVAVSDTIRNISLTKENYIENTDSSDMDRSAMLDYYSKLDVSSNSKWNNTLFRLAQKKKNLEALRYISQRISVISEPAKSLRHEISEYQNVPTQVKDKNEVDFQNNVDITDNQGKSNASFDLSKEARNIKDKAQKDEGSTDNDNIDPKHFEETGSGKDQFATVLLISSKESNETNNDSLKELNITNVYEKRKMPHDTVTSTDTGYPFPSLSLRETFEENKNCQLPCDTVIDQVKEIDMSDFQGFSEHSDSDSRKDYNPDSSPTDLEEIDRDHLKSIKSTKEKKQVSFREENKVITDGRMDGYPLPPEYFNTETGSKRRSKRLYQRVILCRERDSQINACKEMSTNTMSAVSKDVGIKHDANKNMEVANVSGVEESNNLTWEKDGLRNGDSIACVETKADEKNVSADNHTHVVKELTRNLEASGNFAVENMTISKVSVSENKSAYSLNGESQLQTNTLNTVLHNSNDKPRHIRKSLCNQDRMLQFMGHGFAISDVRIVLERCDWNEKNVDLLRKASENERVKTRKLRRHGGVTGHKTYPNVVESVSKLGSKIHKKIKPKQNSPSDKVIHTSESVSDKSRDNHQTDSNTDFSDKYDSLTLREDTRFVAKGKDMVSHRESASEDPLCSDMDITDETVESNYLGTLSTRARNDMNKTIKEANTSKYVSKTQQQDRENENDEVVTRNRLKKDLKSNAFEEQFKTWIEQGDSNNIESETSCRGDDSKVEMHSSKDSPIRTLPNSLENDLINNKAFDAVPASNGRSVGEDVQEKGCTEQCEKQLDSTEVEGTQPFELCQYPQTQEFSPKMSDTEIQTSPLESFTNNNLNHGNDSEFHNVERTVFDLAVHTEVEKPTKHLNNLTNDSLRSNKKNRINNISENIRGLNKKFGLGQVSKSGDHPSNAFPCDYNNKGQNNLEIQSIEKIGTEFTKIIGKTEQLKQLNLKVKPMQKPDILKKRKLNSNVLNESSAIKKLKKQKLVEKDSKDELQVQEIEVIVNDPTELSDVAHEHSTKTNFEKKESSAFRILERLEKIDEDILVTQDDTVSDRRMNKQMKTYEPRKMFIDGHCFGNQVCWQNFIKSPSEAKNVPSETKTKSCAEKTNKRKQCLDSSQGSQNTDIIKKLGKTRKKTVRMNRSSESLFSEENCIVDSYSDSPSLLQCKKTDNKDSSEYLRKVEKKNKKAVNDEHIEKRVGSGELRYLRKDGIPRFYRVSQKDQLSKDTSDPTEYPETGINARERGTYVRSGDTSLYPAVDNVCGKDSNSSIKTTQQNDVVFKNLVKNTQKKKTKEDSNVANKEIGNSKHASLDKQLFIQNWLMTNEGIGEIKDHSSIEELSPPDQTQRNSLPSYQPIDTIQQNEVVNEANVDLTVEQQTENDKSSVDLSSSEITTSSDCEDGSKPLSAAARYLLKLRNAGKRRKSKMLAFKSRNRDQAGNYLKSRDRF